MAGYRDRYDATLLLQMARWQGNGPLTLWDIAERLKVISATQLEIEAKRYEYEKDRRESDDIRKRLAAGVK